MLRSLAPMVCRLQTRACSLPTIRESKTKRKTIEDVLGTAPVKVEAIRIVEEADKGVAGVPLAHQQERVARIFKPAREAPQSAWNNTKVWKIELDNKGRWHNNLIGWASTADPLSNISLHMKFASKEEAIAFCEKNNWGYEVDEPQVRQIKPKSYGSNYSWNKRCRNSTK